MALKEALARFGKPLIFNTDEGSQFTSTDFTDVLRGADVKISMDGRGRRIDYYNEHRPHSRFGGQTSDEVYGQFGATPYLGHAPDMVITSMAA